MRIFVYRSDQSELTIIHILQLIDYPPLTSELKHPFTVALIRLSKASGLYSECLVLNNSIQTIGSDPVASGQFGEVWRGRVQGQEVAVKVLKKYETSDIQKLLKVDVFSLTHVPACSDFVPTHRTLHGKWLYGVNCRTKTSCLFMGYTT